MKILLLIFFVIPIYAVAISKCESSTIQAKADIKRGRVQFMLQGGIVPIHISGKKDFEQKYKVKYIDLGCVVPIQLCLSHYNAEVAKYLDKKYGKLWRKEVKKDVLQPIS